MLFYAFSLDHTMYLPVTQTNSIVGISMTFYLSI
uniref:Uncharacterized protein n=1 Tax=Heterorhabditis bacteriophora TaxID=37862 RepID=A0A1I7WKY9_HETBA